MVRPVFRGLALFVALAGCAPRPPVEGRSVDPPKVSALAADEQRMMACLDLRDHIVSLYADQYVEQQGSDMSDSERAAFRSRWAEEIAKKGTFEDFEWSCFSTLTPRRYHCGMASRSTDRLVACMKLSSR
jgi:hypothetical protein